MNRLMTVIAAVILATSAASAQQGASLYFDTPSPAGELAVGETFTVAVMTDIAGLTIVGVDYSLTWDPSVLEMVTRELSAEWISPFDVSDWLAPSPGWVYFGCVEFAGGSNFTAGAHTVVTYTFRVVGAGTTDIVFGVGTLFAAGVIDSDNNEVAAEPATSGVYPAPIPVTLKVLSVSAPTSATVGDVVEMSAMVENSGGIAADVTVEFWANPTLKVGEVTQNIGAGQTAAVIYEWHTDLHNAATYPMYVVLDGVVTYFTQMHLNAVVVVIPPVVPVTEAGSGGGGSGGGGCSSGSGTGNMVPVMVLLAVLVARRILR